MGQQGWAGSGRSSEFLTPPAPHPHRGSYSRHAAVVRVLAVEESSVLQEHGSCLEDKGGEQLGVDVVPRAVEPPAGGRVRNRWRVGEGSRREEAEQGGGGERGAEWTWLACIPSGWADLEF